MAVAAHVTIHPSQFPDAVRRDLIESLRSRRVNHKFHYDTVKQTTQWLALHEAFSPARTDPDCLATYDAAFTAAVRRVNASAIQLIGLGCGSGQKDVRLLQLLREQGKPIAYAPCDVGVPMVLVARTAALAAFPGLECRPLVCDLATADDLPDAFAAMRDFEGPRLFTFFGMIPNFEPEVILPRLAALLRPADTLLFSANLAPPPDYAAGVQRVLPLYDNELTREWLLTFLLDLGVERSDGRMSFGIAAHATGLLRIEANFEFTRARRIRVNGDKQRLNNGGASNTAVGSVTPFTSRLRQGYGGQAILSPLRGEEAGGGGGDFQFRAGECIRLFFSYRHTPKLIATLLGDHQITVLDQWITKSGEEGVFLCQRG